MSQEDIKDWNRIAHNYAQGAGTAGDRTYAQFKDVLWDSLGNVQGSDILDLGCGSGWLSQQLHEAGARVIGIDGSTELLHIARRSYPDVEFIQHDLSQGIPPLGRTFDRIIAHMVLMDIPDLSTLIQSVSTLLKPEGKFIFTMPHPCFFNMKSHRDETNGHLFRKVIGYLQPEVLRIESFGGHNHYHRSLTYYFDHLRANRLAVTRLYEPEHIPKPGYSQEDEAFHKSIPVFILIEVVLLQSYSR